MNGRTHARSCKFQIIFIPRANSLKHEVLCFFVVEVPLLYQALGILRDRDFTRKSKEKGGETVIQVFKRTFQNVSNRPIQRSIDSILSKLYKMVTFSVKNVI